MKDYLVSSVIRSMTKLINWIVEVYGELTKVCLKYAVNKVFQHDGYQNFWNVSKFGTKIGIKYQNSRSYLLKK